MIRGRVTASTWKEPACMQTNWAHLFTASLWLGSPDIVASKTTTTFTPATKWWKIQCTRTSVTSKIIRLKLHCKEGEYPRWTHQGYHQELWIQETRLPFWAAPRIWVKVISSLISLSRAPSRSPREKYFFNLGQKPHML